MADAGADSRADSPTGTTEKWSWRGNPLAGIWRPSITTEPPTARDLHRNDLALLGFVLALLLAGWLLRFAVKDEAQRVALGEGLPTIVHPDGWVTANSSDDALFVARNPASPSAFDSEMRAAALPVREGESLETVRVLMSLQRNQLLERYRELEAQRVLVGDEPGYLVRYAYVADPTRKSGAPGLPVVVEAQDLIFGSGNQWMIMTTAADAADWEAESAPFTTLHSHLRVQPAVLAEEEAP